MSKVTYKRDAGKVRTVVKELPNGQLFTTQPCKIQVPVRYTDRNLAEIGIDTYVFSIFSIILEDGTYAVSNACAMMKIEPFKVLQTKIKNVEYYEFYFKANSVITYNTNLIRRDVLMYNLIDEFFFKGKVPWFITYDDLASILDTAKKHANSNVAQNYEIIELLASVVTRNAKDRKQYYRHALNDSSSGKPDFDFVPLASVFYSASNTLNKLAGAYFSDGIASALVNPSDSVEHVEALLRA